MTLDADKAARPVATAFEVPLSVLADLTAQAVLLVDPETGTVLFVSTRSYDLLCAGRDPPSLPTALSQLFEPEEGLTERLRFALASSGPLSFGATALGSGARIAAKAQRIDLPDRLPLVLISLQDEPELSRRFRSLSEQILALNGEIARRREAERSLSLTSAALRRSLFVVRRISEIATAGGEHLAVATEAIVSALGAQSAAMITRSGSHFFCSAQIGPAVKSVDAHTPLAIAMPPLRKAWTGPPDERDTMLIAALGQAAGKSLASACHSIIPVTVAGKPEGALAVFFHGDSNCAELTSFENGIIGEALASLLVRADMEARLNQSQKMEAIGQLTGGIAHDFNNILAVVLGNAELILDEMDHDVNALAREIEEAAQLGATLTSRLLSFARKQPLRPESTDINALARNIDPIVRRSIGEDIDLKVITADGLWNAVTDPRQLETALLNLAINARDAMPEGGHLTFETANAVLDHEYTAAHEEVMPGEYVMIGVSDTGTGMDAVTAERAITPFFTTKGVGKGSGLGLSMVYGFVKQSGGHVKIYTELGYGTTVRMYLPRAGAVVTRPDDTSLTKSNFKGYGKILLVEDDPAVLKYTARALIALGYAVDTAKNGAEAISQLDRGSYKLVLTDVVLSGEINGRAVARHANAVAPETPVLFMSGYPQSAIIHHGRLDPDAVLLSKPFTRHELAQTIRGLIGS